RMVSKRAEVAMFRYVTESTTSVGNRHAYVPFSIVTHLALVAVAIVVPLFAPNVLPVPVTNLMAFISPDVPVPPLPPAPPAASSTPRRAPPLEDVNAFAAPIASPSAIAPETIVDTTRGLVRGVEGGVGVVDGGFGARVEPPSPPPTIEPDEPRRVGGV